MKKEDTVLAGFHAVSSRMKRDSSSIRIVYYDPERRDQRMRRMIEEIEKAGIRLMQADNNRLDGFSHEVPHQGLIALAAPIDIGMSFDTLMDNLAGNPLLLLLDGVTDPQNLGAVIRSAAAFGANGVILPERRSASVNAAAWKVSAGAAAHMPVARVVNLTKALEGLKERGYYVVGLDGGGDKLVGETGFESDPLVVVLGSEGSGLGRLVRETCDAIAGIPISSSVESLNASVAAGISLYAVSNARRKAAAE